MEIERKFAIKFFPGELAHYQYKKIEQGYLCNNPIIRIRKSNDDYILTYKSKDGVNDHRSETAIVNQEVELLLTKEAYENLKNKIDGNLIYKTRYLIPIQDGLTAELDVFEGPLSGLVFVEVEFPDLNQANEFIPPNWFGKELSSDKRFSNHQLSQMMHAPIIG